MTIKDHRFLTFDSIKNTRHFFATSTPFELYEYQNYPAEKRPTKEFRKIITGSIYNYQGNLIEHAAMDNEYGSNYICSVNDKVLGHCKHRKIINYFFKRKEKVIKGNSLYIGNWMGQYGHFVVENLSRLWDLGNLNRYDNFIAHPFVFDKNRVKIHPYQSYLLKLLGVNSEKVIPLYEQATLTSVDVPEQAWLIAGPVNIKAKAIYKKIREAHNSEKKCRKIFISKAEKDANRIKNMKEVECFFKKNNYEIIYPETIDIREQLEIYSNCEVMVSFSGSGLHNSVFSNSETLIIELGDPRSPDKPMKTQVAATELIGQEHRFVAYSGTESGICDLKNLVALEW